MTVKLYNKGQRTIFFKEAIILPGKPVALDDATGTYLKTLYTGELVDTNDEIQKFNFTDETAPVVAQAPDISGLAPAPAEDAPGEDAADTESGDDDATQTRSNKRK